MFADCWFDWKGVCLAGIELGREGVEGVLVLYDGACMSLAGVSGPLVASSGWLNEQTNTVE